MAVDERTRARTFFQTVLDQLWIFANREFQESVWIRGDHPSGYVQDYVEAMEVFRDFISWLLANDYWKLVPLTSHQVERLKQFYQLIDRFDEGLQVRDACYALTDPRWETIIVEAKRTLDVLRVGLHEMAPALKDSV